MSDLRTLAKIALDAPKGAGRSELLRVVKSAKLEWDEEERQKLRRENKEGFLLAPESPPLLTYSWPSNYCYQPLIIIIGVDYLVAAQRSPPQSERK